MKIIQAEKPFIIQEIELNSWQQRPVKNNFFELVLIKKGTGTQCIHYNEYPYSKGSIFLLPPLKCHSFTINEPSQFVFLKFTSTFFHQNGDNEIDQKGWFKNASYILSNYNQLPGEIIRSELDRKHVFTISDLILSENSSHSSSSERLIKSLMQSILEILLRNIKELNFRSDSISSNSEDRINLILNYINENIDEPELLKINALSNKFHISPTYLSEFFKKKMNMSLKEYIISSRLKQVEIRLLHSDFSLTEIASEMNFTDVSHLSRSFKKHTGLTLRDFKKRGEYHMLKRNSC